MAESAVDRAALLETYAAGIEAFDGVLASLGPADLDRPQPSGDWTPRQVIHHLADSETMAYVRLRRLIAEDGPELQGYDEPEWARRLHYDRPIESSVAVLRAVRAASLELLRSLTPAEWERAGTHTESGAYSVDRWLRIYANHTHDHADQIRRAAGG